MHRRRVEAADEVAHHRLAPRARLRVTKAAQGRIPPHQVAAQQGRAPGEKPSLVGAVGHYHRHRHLAGNRSRPSEQLGAEGRVGPSIQARLVCVQDDEDGIGASVQSGAHVVLDADVSPGVEGGAELARALGVDRVVRHVEPAVEAPVA